MIPYPSFGRTTAKGPADKPRRVQLVCPACGDRFSLNYSEYRRCIRARRRPCDSPKCGQAYRKIREAEKARDMVAVPGRTAGVLA